MKAVLISIQPKWCELIASGKKTVEVRKTKPKIETPFKCYIYATKPRHYFKISKHLLTSNESLFLINGKVRMCEGFGVEYDDPDYKHLNCKVIGEFVCDNIIKTSWFITPDHPMWKDGFNEEMCLTDRELFEYSKGDTFYEWHISDLVIYDKPKELREFCIVGCKGCRDKDTYHCKFHCIGKRRLTRPPQSWCYVEELKGE